jgi:alpha-glucosidase (family GH31 glycosyl hydrolase)
MGTNPLDFEDGFWKDMEDVVFINVRKDRTINMQTSVQNMEELKSIFSTAYMMAMFQDMKSDPKDVDNFH